MDPIAIIAVLVIGAIAGWLAGLMFSGHGFGYVGDIILGLAGASIAGLLLPGVIAVGFAGQMIGAAMGALVILSMISVVKRR